MPDGDWMVAEGHVRSLDDGMTSASDPLRPSTLCGHAQVYENTTLTGSQAQHGCQLVENRHLPGLQALSRLGEGEPGAAIDLGKALPPPRARWPFHLEFVADDLVGVDLAFDREGMDDLAARLPCRGQRP